jgi:hypothetical protein
MRKRKRKNIKSLEFPLRVRGRISTFRMHLIVVRVAVFNE